MLCPTYSKNSAKKSSRLTISGSGSGASPDRNSRYLSISLSQNGRWLLLAKMRRVSWSQSELSTHRRELYSEIPTKNKTTPGKEQRPPQRTITYWTTQHSLVCFFFFACCLRIRTSPELRHFCVVLIWTSSDVMR